MEELCAAFAKRGHEGYGEGVSQLEHALQCAVFARTGRGLRAAGRRDPAARYRRMPHDLPEDIADAASIPSMSRWVPPGSRSISVPR